MLIPPASVQRRFARAGWWPERAVNVPSQVSTSHPAYQVLASFGGLHVVAAGGGEECAKGDIVFQLLDPPDGSVLEWGALLSVKMIGVGEVHGGNAGLYVDSLGRFFGLSWIHDAFYIHGENFATAVEAILLGRRARPLLRPNQEFEQLYGDIYTSEDPGVYRFG